MEEEQKKKKTRESELEKMKGDWGCWNVCGEKEKRRGGDRDNVCGGGDNIGEKKKKQKQKQKRMAVMKRLKREII